MKPLLIVDGYNIIGAWPEARRAGWTMEESREHLLRELQSYAGFSGSEIVLVFDGYQSDRKFRTEETYGDVTLVYTMQGETADSYIERRAALNPRYRPMSVATNDGLEQSQILSSGAVRVTARELLRELSQSHAHGMRAAASRTTKPGASIGEQLPEDVLRQLEDLRRNRT